MRFHMVKHARQPVSPSNHTVETDGFVSLTGQMPDMPEPPGILPDGIEAQMRQVTTYLATILAEIGLRLEHVAMARVCLTRFEEDYQPMNAVNRMSWAKAGDRRELASGSPGWPMTR